MFSAVLFDLDGVLADTEDFSSESSRRVLAAHGIARTEKESARAFGRRTVENFQEMISARGLDLDAEELVTEKNKIFIDLIKDKLEPLPGVTELIKELDEAGIKKAVVSSSPLERVTATLKEIKLLDEFDVVLSGDCCKLGKPDPEPFLLAAEKLGVPPAACVVVEDAEAGVLAAKAAGMRAVAVKTPSTFGQDLSKADAAVESTSDVNLALMKKLFNNEA